MAKQGSSTKQLKQTLGFWDLMSTAIGQIIGAGIMTLLGSAIALTGRSVPISFLIAAVLVVGYSIPKIRSAVQSVPAAVNTPWWQC